MGDGEPVTSGTPDRRAAIAAAAVEILAADGTRGLTHRAVDRRLDLPAGSTSYYFRTRDALLRAAADAVRAASRTAFERLLAGHDDPIALITAHLETLLTAHRTVLLARRALHTELAGFDAPLFSPDGAAALAAARGLPAAAGPALLTLLEGAVTVGLRTGAIAPVPPLDTAALHYALRRLLG